MIRNFLFSIFFYLGIILISIIFLPSFFLPQKIVLFGGKLMGHWASVCLKIFLSTKIIIKGKENLIYNEKFFIASSHQSMFETFFLQTIFNSPIFILKKELLKIPIFGWYLIKIGSISINRGKTTKENLNFFEKVAKIVRNENRPLLIFPQGTRVKFQERFPFKKGAGRIYEALNIACVPVALNSGKVWPKNSFLKYPGKITVSFLQPIEPGIDRETFLRILEKKIYDEMDAIK